MITKQTCYCTRDGQKFDNLADANLHEAALELMSVFIAKGFVNDGTLKSICVSMAKDYTRYSEALSNLKNKATRATNKRKQTVKSE